MKDAVKHKGFSLAEILMAIGIMSIGMLLIAALFPAGIHFTTIATERTIASAAADEAFAKIRMYCDDPCVVFGPGMVAEDLTLFPEVQSSYDLQIGFSPDEFSYPSAEDVDVNRRIYFWSAVWRRLSIDPSDRRIQVTVFVSRKVWTGTLYYELLETGILGFEGNWPVPLPVNIIKGSKLNEIVIDEAPNSPKRNFINAGGAIVDGKYGRIYRVLERSATNPDVIILDGAWLGGADSRVWVIPPPVGGGRYPCIAVYQKVIRF